MKIIQKDISLSDSAKNNSECLTDCENQRYSKFRFIRVFVVTFKILLSLGIFSLLSNLFGSNWADRKKELVYGRNARRLKKVLLSLKGIFIKIGQLISISSNFLPEYFRKDLEDLQDRIPPQPYNEIIVRIKNELGKNPSLLFAEFDKNPIASASLAQVHLARLHDGRQVAVKVQYPGIEEIVKKDLETVKTLLFLFEHFSEDKRTLEIFIHNSVT